LVSIGARLTRCVLYTTNSMRVTKAIDIFHDNLDEIADALVTNLDMDLETLEKEYLEASMPEHWIAEEVKKLTIEERFGKRIRTLKHVQRAIHARDFPSVAQNHITDADIERAKEYPIEELYPGDLTRGTLKKGRCPFHSEKTASFFIKNNRYRCYGCGVYGDSIDFYQKLHNVTFKEAIRQLQ